MKVIQTEKYDYYDGVNNHLYNFAAEVDKMELEGRLSHKKANLLQTIERYPSVTDLLLWYSNI